MDESRFGLQTIQRRVLTLKGIKPLLPYQHRFENFYLFGAYSPVSGAHFTLELPQCNAAGFQLYLTEFSKQAPDELKILILDNGAFHKAKGLDIPPNIVLLFLPPYSPELNAAEKIWRHLKDQLANQVFPSLDSLSDQLMRLLNQLSPLTIKSLTAFNYCTSAFNACFL
jgi:transposase